MKIQVTPMVQNQQNLIEQYKFIEILQIQFQSICHKHPSCTYKSQLKWDAAGDQMLNYIKNQHLKQIDAILFMFDLTDQQSLYHLQNLMFQIINNSLGSNHISMILVGNKSDLIQIDQQKDKQGNNNLVNYIAQKIAKRHSVKYFRVSAKQNSFVTDAIVQIIKDHLKFRRNVRTSRLQQQKQHSFFNKVQCKLCQHCIIY